MWKLYTGCLMREKMSFFRSLILSFSMYSKLPMPFMKWEDDSMKYALMFFPLVGFVEAMLFVLFMKLLSFFNIDGLMRAALMTVFPIFYTGAIHIDGFMDTVDAISSRADKEKKLQILKDSHVGAFAAIGIAMYLLLYTSFADKLIDHDKILIFALAFVENRCYSIYSLMTIKNARGSGYAATFVSAGARVTTLIGIIVMYVLSAAATLYISLKMGLAVLAVQFLAFLYCRYMFKREFGGTTGDLSGFLLQIFEILVLLVLVLL